MSLVIVAHLDLHPDDVATAAAATKALVEITREEPGCRHYAFGIDTLQPNILRISEWWEDEAALAQHLQLPHVRAFVATVGTLRVNAMEAKKYTVSAVGPVSL